MNDVSVLYRYHGVNITNRSNGELLGTCPFCGKEGHFYIEAESGLYYCQRCKEGGNLYQFLQWKGLCKKDIKKELMNCYLWDEKRTHIDQHKQAILESCQKLIQEKPKKLMELAEIRKFENKKKAVELMRKHNVCVDGLHNFIFPLYSADSLLGLQRYNPEGVTSLLKNGDVGVMKDGKEKPITSAMMSGHNVGIFGCLNATDNPVIHTFIVCESPIKAFHLQLQGFNGTDGTLAVGIVGAGNLPKGQKQIFKEKKVYFCYDYDFSVDNPGQKGAKFDARKICDITKEIKNIVPSPELIEQFKEKEYDKVDLADDYWLAGGTIEEFNRLIEKAQKIVNEDAQLELCKPSIPQSGDYVIDSDGCLYRNKLIKDGVIKQKLANFNAEIKREIIKDDGIDQTYNYIIVGKLKNIDDLPQVEIPADKFASMNWMHNWGARAIIEPGYTTKDCVRHYIQLNSNAKRTICFTHTGWRQINNKWVYLTGNGAIGVDNVSVELSRELQRYHLPSETISKDEEVESIQVSLSFLEIGKKNITYPLFSFAYLAPLTTLLNPMPNFSGYVLGNTGLYKTSITIVALSHFGNFGNISTLPNFSDTPNSIEKRAFTLKDTLMILDDFHPSSQKAEALRTESTAQRVIRAFSNRTGRGRLNPDSTDKGRYEPRGILLITGEELVTLQSTLARVLVIEVGEGGIYKDKLSKIQENLNLLPHSMASYISWVKNHIKDVHDKFQDRFTQLRIRAQNEGMHNKLPEQVAYLTFSMETVLSWLTEKSVINEKKAGEIIDEAWDIFVNLASLQSRRIKSEDPIQKFVDILHTLIIQEKVRLEFKGEDSASATKGGDNGEMIGYYDAAYFYLLPSAMWRTIQIFCRDEGSHFPVSSNTFYGMLRKKGLIKTRKKENVISVKIKGKSVRTLQLYRDVIDESDNLLNEDNDFDSGYVSG